MIDMEDIQKRAYQHQRPIINTNDCKNIPSPSSSSRLIQTECANDVLSVHEMQMVHGLMFIMSIPMSTHTHAHTHTQSQLQLENQYEHQPYASRDSKLHGKCMVRSWIHDRRRQRIPQQHKKSQASMNIASTVPFHSIQPNTLKSPCVLTRTSIIHHGTRVGITQPRAKLFHNISNANPALRRKPCLVQMHSSTTDRDTSMDTETGMDEQGALEIIGVAYSKAAGVAALPAPMRARRRLNAFMPMTMEERDKALEQAKAQYLGYRQKQMHDLEELTKSPFRKSPLHDTASTRSSRSGPTHRSIPPPSIPNSAHASNKRMPLRSPPIPNQNRLQSGIPNVLSVQEHSVTSASSLPANTSPSESPKASKTKSLDSRLRIRVKESEHGSHARKPYGYWNNLVNVRAELEEFLAEVSDELNSSHHRKIKLVVPTFPELVRRNRHDLIGALRKFGGRKAAAKALGIPLVEYPSKPAKAEKVEQVKTKAILLRRPRGYWKDMDNCVLELSKYIKDHNKGVVPSITELRKDKQFTLLKSIQFHGGISVVLEHLPFVKQSNKKPYGYWSKIENVKNELVQFATARKSAVPFAGTAATSMNSTSSNGGGSGKYSGRTASSGSSTTRFARSAVVVRAHVVDDVHSSSSVTDLENEESQVGEPLPPWLSFRQCDLIHAGHASLAKAVIKFGGLEKLISEIRELAISHSNALKSV